MAKPKSKAKTQHRPKYHSRKKSTRSKTKSAAAIRTTLALLLASLIASSRQILIKRTGAAAVLLLLLGAAVGLTVRIENFKSVRQAANAPVKPTPVYSHATLNELKTETAQLQSLEDKRHIKLADRHELWSRLDTINHNLDYGDKLAAVENIQSYRARLSNLTQKLARANKGQFAAAAQAADIASPKSNVPILIYHHTPPDFSNQLTSLRAKGYITITMDNLSDHLRYGRPLPAKPVILTFDDGFSNQKQAFNLLKAHQAKATFYIITSGEVSRWCIGAGRRHDQVAPCGDAYLNWEEIIELDRSGLIEIAAHSVDHRALTSLPAEKQKFQIDESKKVLEAKLGHPIDHFAYPYGSFNQSIADITSQSGFVTAVTTKPGSEHDLGSIYTLTRVRDAYVLP